MADVDDLITALLDETMMVSSSSTIMANAHYQELMSLGRVMQYRVIERLREGEIRIPFFHLLAQSTGCNPVRHENRGIVDKMREDWLAWVDAKSATALRTEIEFGGKVLCICDRLCGKAWGINSRPKHQFDPENEPDDYVSLADDEVDTAPLDPGTYEGSHGKPFHPTKHNKWCVRECERSEIIGKGDVEVVRTFEKRSYNMLHYNKDKCASVVVTGHIYRPKQ